MTASDTISRLTEREKEVLRAWLAHKSAKEIAIDLGITHHAVEKRLKMARTKLGAATSLEAARMLAAAEGASEGYGQAVTAPPDLPASPPLLPYRRYRPYVLGGIAMSLSLVLAFALAPARPLAPDAERAVAAAASADAASTEIEIDGDLGKLFAHHDTNGSGFLEKPESPVVEIAFVDRSGPKSLDGTAVVTGGDSPGQIAEFYTEADTDADGRISLAEFTGWSKARWAEMGIEARMVMKVYSGAPTPDAGRSYPAGMRAASECETNAFMRSAFASFDRDGSKTLGPAEAGALEPGDTARDRALGPAPATGQTDPAAEAKWIALLDRDGSQTVSESEYMGYMLPWMLLNGVPEGWSAPEADACQS